jgi:RNA polymerase sigma factor (sigma-70 family)
VIADLRAAALPPLPRDEQAALAVKARAGDRAAEERLLRSVLRMVFSVTAPLKRRLKDHEEWWDDLDSEGVLGALRAMQDHDDRKGSFSSHARRRIETFARLFARDRILSVRVAHESSPQKRHEVQAARAGLRMQSFDAPLAAGREATRYDVMTAEEPESTERTQLGARQHLDHLLEDVEPRVRLIINRRLEGAGLNVIGAEIGLSHERVRQLEWKGLRHLARCGGAGATVRGLRASIERPNANRARPFVRAKGQPAQRRTLKGEVPLWHRLIDWCRARPDPAGAHLFEEAFRDLLNADGEKRAQLRHALRSHAAPSSQFPAPFFVIEGRSFRLTPAGLALGRAQEAA